MGQLRVISFFLDFILLFVMCAGRDVDSSYVTCGSLVKLMNTRHSVRLHSHDVKYGSGIKQSLVLPMWTCFKIMLTSRFVYLVCLFDFHLAPLIVISVIAAGACISQDANNYQYCPSSVISKVHLSVFLPLVVLCLLVNKLL